MNTAGQLWYRHLFSPPMLLPVRSLTLLSLAAPFLAFSQATTPVVKDDPPPKLDVVEEQVKSLAEVREAGRIRFLKDVYAKIISVLNQSGAAGDFVIDCMRTVRFRGQENGNVDFAEWKKANRNLYSDRDFQKAAELHLQYLALTLERATLESSEPLQKKVWAHLARLVDAVDLHRIGCTHKCEDEGVPVFACGRQVGLVDEDSLAGSAAHQNDGDLVVWPVRHAVKANPGGLRVPAAR